MKFFEDVELHEIPYRFSYRRITSENYKGFYHCHQGMEFLYVYQGTGQIVVNSKVYPIQSGTFLYLQPYQLHHIQVEVHPDAPFERTIISLEPSIFEHHFASFPHLNVYFSIYGKMNSRSRYFTKLMTIALSASYFSITMLGFPSTSSMPNSKISLYSCCRLFNFSMPKDLEIRWIMD